MRNSSTRKIGRQTSLKCLNTMETNHGSSENGPVGITMKRGLTEKDSEVKSMGTMMGTHWNLRDLNTAGMS